MTPETQPTLFPEPECCPRCRRPITVSDEPGTFANCEGCGMFLIRHGVSRQLESAEKALALKRWGGQRR